MLHHIVEINIHLTILIFAKSTEFDCFIAGVHFGPANLVGANNCIGSAAK